MILRLAVCLLAVALGLSRSAPAQLRAGLDALVVTRYVWRGVERTNGIVIQPDAYVAYGLGGAGWITVGVWGNFELHPPSATDLSDRTAKRGLGERDAWVQVTHQLGDLDGTLGWIGYFRRASLVRGPDDLYDTHEVYASLQARSSYLSPRLSAWWDLSRVRGLYLEGSVDVPVMGSFRGKSFWAIYLTATAGLNAGQGPDSNRPLAPVNFAEKGLTHLDVGAAVNIRGPWTDRWAAVLFEAHLQLNRDPYAKRHSLTPGDDDHLVTVWAGMTLGLPSYRATGE